MAPIEYEILPGRSRENAETAIAKAEENGFSGADVQTFRGGYRIPVEVDDEGKEVSGESDGEDEPDIDKMNVEALDKFIGDNSLDVDLGLNKKDKVAAIKAARESKGD